ncbi:MAG: NADH-quinone oxidoreductase subunit J [Sulfuricellaceae bacterium]|jgi:NADH-quinone oxidoreductase subunit J
MNFETMIFYIFSAILLLSAARVVTAKSPVHAALSLVLAFFTAAAIWLLLEAEFLAITLVLVYVGAVTVLFLFVVMTLDFNVEKMRQGFWRHLPAALVAGGIMAAEMVLVLRTRTDNVAPRNFDAHYSNTKELGRLLYTDYVYPFELAAVLLLVAIIAAIALTLRRRKDTKYIDPADQVKVRREDRLRLVSMPAEKPAQAPAEKTEG